MFKKYQHIERFGTTEVEGIELGKVYIFPKIDGCNCSVWSEDGRICCGSRNRALSTDNDHQGFMGYILSSPRYERFFRHYPGLRLYGEWLVPHTLKTYSETAWRKHYIFDVVCDTSDRYLSYEEYQPLMEEFGLDYIPPIAIVNRPDPDKFIEMLEKNVFLIPDGGGFGEGIVIKNYSFVNRFHRTTWAKIVRNEFKEKHSKVMGPPEIEGVLRSEYAIVDDFLTKAMVEKVKAKIENECGYWSSKHIPRFLGTVYHDLVTEELWEAIKKHKSPTVNFKMLQKVCYNKTKELLPEVFS